MAYGELYGQQSGGNRAFLAVCVVRRLRDGRQDVLVHPAMANIVDEALGRARCSGALMANLSDNGRWLVANSTDSSP